MATSIGTVDSCQKRRRRKLKWNRHGWKTNLSTSASCRFSLISSSSWSVLAVLTSSIALLLSGTQTVTLVDSFGIPDPVVHFGVGAVAGGVGAIVAFPFEYIKTQMQTEYGKAKWKNGMDAFIDIITSESDGNGGGGGPLQLYKGLGVQLLGIAPEKGIKHGVNDVLAATFVTATGSFPVWGQILSGAVAGACQVVVSSPLEVMKVGLQTSDMTLEKVWIQVGGVRGLYRGSQACIVRDVLWTAICFPLYTLWVHQSVPSECMVGAMNDNTLRCTESDLSH